MDTLGNFNSQHKLLLTASIRSSADFTQNVIANKVSSVQLYLLADGYDGPSCLYTREQLQQKIYQRDKLINSFVALNIVNVSSVTLVQRTALEAAVRFLSIASQVGVSYDSIGTILQSADDVIAVSTNNSHFMKTVNLRALSADSVDSVEEDSGALQLVAMTEFVASDFEDTFTAAPKMTTLQEIEQLAEIGAEVSQSPAAIREYLVQYVLEDAFVKVEQTVFTAARRASTVAFNATNEFVKKLAFKKATVAVAGLESRTVPMSTSVAQELASASVNLIAARAKMLVFRQQIDSANAKGALRSRGVEYQKNAEKFSDDDDCDDDHGSADENQSERPQSTNKKGYLSQVESPPSSRLDMLAKPTQQLFEELAEDVILQRRLLKTCELEEYDRQWGIDPAGEFISGERFFCSCFKLREGAKEAICREIDQVKLATRAKDESDSHFNDEKSDFDGGISVSKKSSNNLELSGLNSLDSAQIDVSFGDSLSAVTIEVPSDSNF
eukprot:gene18618-18909_t